MGILTWLFLIGTYIVLAKIHYIKKDIVWARLCVGMAVLSFGMLVFNCWKVV